MLFQVVIYKASNLTDYRSCEALSDLTEKQHTKKRCIWNYILNFAYARYFLSTTSRILIYLRTAGTLRSNFYILKA